MPLGDRPILEIVVTQLRDAGYLNLTMAVGHLASLIQAYFGDGEHLGVNIDYSMEDEPLGTAGPISLIDRPDDDFLVMNGDILTDLDYAALFADHKESGDIATLVTYTKGVDLAFGVIDTEDDKRITSYTEKPSLSYLVSTGIYCFRPDVLDWLEPGAPRALPDLMQSLVDAKETVRAYHHQGYWLDIGRPEDYEIAQEEMEAGRFSQKPTP